MSPSAPGLVVIATILLSLCSGAAGDTVTLPVTYRLGFELPTREGQEFYADDDVPILKKGQFPTQEHWTQVFGSAADPENPDRFSRDPHNLARFTRRNVHRGKRALWLRTTGDHYLLRTTRRFPLDRDDRRRLILPQEARLEIGGYLMCRGLEKGSVGLRVRFFRGGFELPGTRVWSPRVSGRRDWRPDLVLSAGVPSGAEKFEVQVLLEGSFEDRIADVWVDDLEIVVLPACTLTWPGLENQLVQRGQDIPLELSCYGLEFGEYAVDIELDRQWPPGEVEPLKMRTSRFALANSPLRLREELRSQLGVNNGIYKVSVRVVDGEDTVVASSGSSIAVIGADPGVGSRHESVQLQLSWVVHVGEAGARETIGKVTQAAREYPIHGILVDFTGVEPDITQPRESVAGETDAATTGGGDLPELDFTRDGNLAWSGRVEWKQGTVARVEQILEQNLSSIDRWEIVLPGPGWEGGDRQLRKLVTRYSGLEFGAATEADGDVPSWAGFRVFRIDAEISDRVSAGAEDWALVSLPAELSRNDCITAIGRLAFELVRRGFRHLLHRRRVGPIRQPSRSRRLLEHSESLSLRLARLEPSAR